MPKAISHFIVMLGDKPCVVERTIDPKGVLLPAEDLMDAPAEFPVIECYSCRNAALRGARNRAHRMVHHTIAIADKLRGSLLEDQPVVKRLVTMRGKFNLKGVRL